MKKTLKTLINTSLLMLFVSHSYGKVYNLPDVSHIVNTPPPGWASPSNNTTLLDANTHPEFNGVGDTFDGSITFEFTLTFDSYPNKNTNFALIEFKNTQIGDLNLATTRITIGNFPNSDVWDANQGSVISDPFNFGNNPVVVGQSQSFTLTIDYRDGLESGTLSISGDPTIYQLPWNYYSFDRIDFTSGFGGTNASATNISLSIIPEPATYALIFGALAFGFVAVRRRFKA